MSSKDSRFYTGKLLKLKSTEITVVNRTTVSGVTQETVQSLKKLVILGSDATVRDISAEFSPVYKQNE